MILIDDLHFISMFMKQKYRDKKALEMSEVSSGYDYYQIKRLFLEKCNEITLSQKQPVMIDIRWKAPAALTSIGCCLKPRAADTNAIITITIVAVE